MNRSFCRCIDTKSIVWNGSYDPNGNVTVLTGTVTQSLRFPGQILDASGLHYNGFRNYIPKFASGAGRYLEADPIGQIGGANLYPYASNNPFKYVDPLGLDVVVVTGDRKGGSNNIFGHSAIGVTGFGIYSYGTGTPLGSSVSDYVATQSQVRNLRVSIIKTSVMQDVAVLKYLNSQPEGIGIVKDNCSTRTLDALTAAGLRPRDPALFSLLPPAMLPAPVQRSISNLPNSLNIYIPRGGVLPDLRQFDPAK